MDLLQQMATLVRVVDAGSLSKAAGQLRLSTAAVSRQLSTLEAQLGSQLLVRTTRSVTTTAAGQVYCDRARRILTAVDEAHAALPDARAARGLLRVSAPVTFGLSRICPVLPLLLADNPGLQIDLRLEDRPVDLIADGIDLAISLGALDDGDHGELPLRGRGVVSRFGAYGRHAVAAPSYLRGRAMPKEPAALAAHEALLQVTGDGPVRVWRFRTADRQARVAVNGAFCTNVVYALRDAALAGLGVALLPEWLVHDDIEKGRLHRLLPSWSAKEVSVFAVYREELRGAARLRAVVDGLRTTWRPEGASAAARADLPTHSR
jgi:DNA-binding transcriptional LysR family regulator